MRVQVAQVHIDHKGLVILLGMLIGVLAFSYVFFVHKTIRNVVARRSLETENNELASRASELEFSYMEQKNDITPEQALSAGFIETHKVSYIPKTQAVALLTLNR